MWCHANHHLRLQFLFLLWNPQSLVTSTIPVDDSNLPIAIRKGVRTYTQHLISKFVSYDSLSSSYCAFVLSLSFVSIPHNWKEALTNPNWKEAMAKEMRALNKNGT